MEIVMATENDIVLIYFDDKPTVFGRLESIEPDYKKNWYHVTILLLTIPMQTVTWILRDTYIDGEPFTMKGSPVRLEAVKKTQLKASHEDTNPSKTTSSTEGKGSVIPFKKTKA
jgi:hypothetical protein